MIYKTDKYYIDIKEVIDYAYCPMMYKFKYIDNLKDKYITVLEEYDTCMHKCIYSFFTQAKFNNNISISNLKTTFGSYWIKSNSLSNIIYSEPSSWRDTRNEKRKQGIDAIVKFYNTIKNNVGIPLIINKPYEVPIAKNIILTGNFEIIREINIKDEKNIEILSIISDGKFYKNTLTDKDLNITASSYAFKKTFNEAEDSIKCFSVDKGKVISTYRNKNDYKMLINTVISVSKCIKNNIFYVCPTKKCLNCAYKTLCLNN